MNIAQLKKWFKSTFYISKLPLEKKEDLLNFEQASVWLEIKFRCGEEFAITQHDMEKKLEREDRRIYPYPAKRLWTSDKVRDIIRELRVMGFPIMSSPRSVVGGYHTPATRKELDEYVARSYKQARTIMWPIKRVRKGGIDWLYFIRQKTLPLKQRDFE